MSKNKKRLVRELWTQLTEEYPSVFNLVDPKPVAIGIHEQLRDVLEVDEKILHQALRNWTSSDRYLRSICELGAVRYNLDGSESDQVTEESRLHAKEKLKEIRSRDILPGAISGLFPVITLSQPFASLLSLKVMTSKDRKVLTTYRGTVLIRVDPKWTGRTAGRCATFLQGSEAVDSQHDTAYLEQLFQEDLGFVVAISTLIECAVDQPKGCTTWKFENTRRITPKIPATEVPDTMAKQRITEGVIQD